MRVRHIWLISLVALVSLALAAPARATFPGANGKIAFVTYGVGEAGIYSVNPDGSNPIQIGNGQFPRWRPDGQKIAFLNGGAFLMNPDGSDVQPLSTSNPEAYVNSWSPDGQKITYSVFRGDPVAGCAGGQLYTEIDVAVANADGTGQTLLTGANGVRDLSPAWSPDGSRIAFARAHPTYIPPGEDGEGDCWSVGTGEIFVMNADGTGVMDLGIRGDLMDWSPDGQRLIYGVTSGGFGIVNADGTNPRNLGLKNAYTPAVWSPDGAKLVFSHYFNNGGIFTSNADGTGVLNVHNGANDAEPNWQSIPVPDYPHPQSAPQLQVALVPAFRQCGTGGNPSNSKHAPSLAVDSCNPPRPGSVLAAFGAASWGSASLTTIAGDGDLTNGNQANFGIGTNLADIQAVAGGDYDPNPAGADLTTVIRLRITDKANGYGGLPATATEYDLRVPVNCAPTADPSLGSTCSAGTSANALFPGFIWEQRQTVVQAFRVRVDDAGNNGLPGDSDDRIFATQGVFVP